MARYFRLWTSFLRASVLADTEYRLNIVLRVFSETVWYATQLALFEVLFTHANAINGWTVHATRVFQGTLFLIENLYVILFSENLDALNSMVRKGELDMYLVKPINAQFMVSTRRVAVSYLPNMILVLAYLIWAIRDLPDAVPFAQLLTYAALVPCGLMTYYAMRFMFGTLVIVLQDAGNVQFVWFQLFRLATRPDSLYPNGLRWAIFTILPVAFIASVPARALLGGLDARLLIAAPLVAIGLLWLSTVTWRAALKRYASASS